MATRRMDVLQPPPPSRGDDVTSKVGEDALAVPDVMKRNEARSQTFIVTCTLMTVEPEL